MRLPCISSCYSLYACKLTLITIYTAAGYTDIYRCSDSWLWLFSQGLKQPHLHLLVPCIDNHGFQFADFKDVVQRLPIGCCALHGDHFAAAFLEPVSHFQKFSGCRTESTYLLLVALFKAGYDQLLVQVNTTTFVVNFIYKGTS